MIREKIDKIVNKYYNETDECYNSFRYDDKENEFYMEEEIEEYLTVEKVDFKIENVSGYSNSGIWQQFSCGHMDRKQWTKFIYVVAGRILTLVNKND